MFKSPSSHIWQTFAAIGNTRGTSWAMALPEKQEAGLVPQDTAAEEQQGEGDEPFPTETSAAQSWEWIAAP